MLPNVLQAADELSKQGVSAQVVSFHTVKPLDEQLLAQAFSQFGVVATIEEHSIIGGLGGAVAEWLSDRAPQKARLLRIGVADKFLHEAGEQEYAREYFGLTPEAIAHKTFQMYRAVAPQAVTV
jgi:transketolase